MKNIRIKAKRVFFGSILDINPINSVNPINPAPDYDLSIYKFEEKGLDAYNLDSIANSVFIESIPDDKYGFCPCGCGKRIRFIEKENEEDGAKHLEVFKEKFLAYLRWKYGKYGNREKEKITLSRSQWEIIGNNTGWLKIFGGDSGDSGDENKRISCIIKRFLLNYGISGGLGYYEPSRAEITIMIYNKGNWTLDNIGIEAAKKLIPKGLHFKVILNNPSEETLWIQGQK